DGTREAAERAVRRRSAQWLSVRDRRGVAGQEDAAGALQPAHDRAFTQRGFRSVHGHSGNPPLLRGGGPGGAGLLHPRNLVLRASATGRTEEVQQDESAGVRGVPADDRVVGQSTGERTRLEVPIRGGLAHSGREGLSALGYGQESEGRGGP